MCEIEGRLSQSGNAARTCKQMQTWKSLKTDVICNQKLIFNRYNNNS